MLNTYTCAVLLQCREEIQYTCAVLLQCREEIQYTCAVLLQCREEIQYTCAVLLQCREDILFDCIHGLLVVVISLIGFISVVWLKDQLGHGLGPNWLEEDRQEVNRVAMREAQERVDVLRRHLEEAGARALERQVVPDRVAVATELSQLCDKLNQECSKLAGILYAKFIVRLWEMWKREMEIMYDLNGSLLSCKALLLNARRKKYKRLQQWQSENGMEVRLFLFWNLLVYQLVNGHIGPITV